LVVEERGHQAPENFFRLRVACHLLLEHVDEPVEAEEGSVG
jgi:hypothetical protein